MTRRVDSLTPEQWAQMEPYAQQWIDRGLRTTPLTEEEWAHWEDGARYCYELANIPFPTTIVRVPSPMVGAFAAPIASYVIAKLRQGGAVGDAVGGAVRGAVDGAVRGAVRGAVGGAVDGAVGGAVRGAVDGAVGGAVRGAVGGAVDGAVGGAVDGAVDDAVRGAVDGAVDGAVRGAVDGAVGGAVDGAVGGAVRGAVDGAVRGAVRGAVGGAVDGAVGGAVGGAVDGAVGGAVDDAVDDAVRGAVDGAVDGAVRGAVDGAVDGAVRGAVDGAVDGAVRGAVDGAVGDAVGDADQVGILRTIQQSLRWLGGRFGGGWYYAWGLSPWWQSYWGFFRDIVGVELDGDLWDRTRKAEAAASAGYWWPFRDFVMVCDNPVELHMETAGGRQRMHCETGPAISWSDGYGIYMWHGTQVPADLIEHGWAVKRIWAEENLEVRRCAIERMGWAEFIRAAELNQVGTPEPDPGNPGFELTLYDVPRDVFDTPIRALLCTNASEERDGTRRRFGLTVPADMKTPTAAAAWTFGLSEADYKQLAAAC